MADLKEDIDTRHNIMTGGDAKSENLNNEPSFEDLNKIQNMHGENRASSDKIALLQGKSDISGNNSNVEHSMNVDGIDNKAMLLDIETTASKSELHLEASNKNCTFQDKTKATNVTMEKNRQNEPITVKKNPYKDKDDSVVYVASFSSAFSMLLCALPVSPTKAWIYNFDTAKLIDIETAEEIKVYDATSVGCAFYHMKVVDENRIFFQDTADNSIKEMKVKNSAISVVSCDTMFAKNEIFSFTLLKKGGIVVCVNKDEGFLCFKKYAPYLQLYSSYGNFLRESKLEFKGLYLLQDAYDIVENNNGDIWIAGEKTKDSEWIVVLDKNFKFRFTYERGEGYRFSATTLGVCPNNNILALVLKDQNPMIDVIDENGHFLRQLPLDGFSQEGSPTSVSVDQDGKAWIVTSIEKIVCIQL